MGCMMCDIVCGMCDMGDVILDVRCMIWNEGYGMCDVRYVI